MMKEGIEKKRIEDEVSLLFEKLEEELELAKVARAEFLSLPKLKSQLIKIKKELDQVDQEEESEPEERAEKASKLQSEVIGLKKKIDEESANVIPLKGKTIAYSQKILSAMIIRLLSRCNDYMRAVQSPFEASPLSDPTKAKTILNGFNLLAQAYKQKKAYWRLASGKKYRVAGITLPKGKKLAAPNLIEKLSKENLTALKRSLRDQGGKQGFGLKSKELKLFKTLLDLPFKLQHATNHFYEIARSGSLDSLSEVQRRTPGFSSFFSTKGNISALGNDGFAFFRVFVDGFNGESTRYGKTRILLDLDVLRRCGWISLHDQLYPFSTTNGKRFYEEKRLLMTAQPCLLKGTGKSQKSLYDGLKYTY